MKRIQPESEIEKDCVLMMTNILAEPDWINVPCSQKIPAIIFCQKIIKKGKLHYMGNSTILNMKDIKSCNHSELFIENMCIVFQKHGIHTNLSELKYDKHNRVSFDVMVLQGKSKQTLIEYFTNIQKYYIQPIQFAVSILINNTFLIYKALQSIHFLKLIWMNKISSNSISEYNGYMLYANKPGKISIPSNVFKCNDGSYIEETSVCDGNIDCIDETDEIQCYCNDTYDMYQINCKFVYDQIPHHYSCSAFYFTCLSSFICIPYFKVCDGHNDCLQGEDELCRNQSGKDFEIVKNLSITTFTCFESNSNISDILVDDFIPDCPNTFEDEIQYINLMTNPFHNHISCETAHELPCIPGHSHCFPLNKLCIFEFQTETRTVKHCRNGAHLYNCTHFQCSEYFKCPMSYCIPFDLICNGKWDCPLGNDEMNCHMFSCPNLFKCKNQTRYFVISKKKIKNQKSKNILGK